MVFEACIWERTKGNHKGGAFPIGLVPINFLAQRKGDPLKTGREASPQQEMTI